MRLFASACAVLCGTFILSIAACGSRTGLFGPDGLGVLPDGASADGAFDGPTDGAVPCVPGKFNLELAVAQLMFVIDRSGSMAFAINEDTAVDPPNRRWDILRSALDRSITPLDQQLAMGAKFFPEPLSDSDQTDPVRSCRTDTGVGIAPARGNVNAILNVFDTTEPIGGTPTSEALRLAAEFLQSSRTVARTMVLATDGAPNCNGDLDPFACVCTSTASCTRNPERGKYSCLDDDRTIATIRDIFENKKIPVYVIGIGSLGSPAFLNVLDDMAIAGGRPRATTPRHYNAQSATELQNALTTIRDSIAKCTYLTPSAPTDPNAISVEIDGLAIVRDPTHQSGWDWVDKQYGVIAFFGSACERAQMGSTKSVTGVVSCEKD